MSKTPVCVSSVVSIEILRVLLFLFAKMHLMYYLNNEGKRIYTLKVIRIKLRFRFGCEGLAIFYILVRSHVFSDPTCKKDLP